MTLQGYYNRFNTADRYDELLFRASKGLQSAELNEVQAILTDRIKKIANVLFIDGALVRDGGASIDQATGNVSMGSGAVYVKGAVREIAAATFTIPTTGDVGIGFYLTQAEITELEDSSLRDPAIGTRNYQEAGAGRTQTTVVWGYSGDGQTGNFYNIYNVKDGALVTEVSAPDFANVTALVARYDREANGNYGIEGLRTVAEGADGSGNYDYTITGGLANVLGYKVDKPSATQLNFAIDPDLDTIANEPKTSTGVATQTVTLNNGPLDSIDDVVVTLEKTVTVIHGSFTGSLDPLPDTSVLTLVTVSQGGTTYASGTDFNLTADQVDWSPAGAEPAPGSSYSVTYQYLDSVSAANLNTDDATFEVTGAVTSSLILVDYTWKLPRYDVFALDSEGLFHRIKGQGSRFTPAVPLAFVPDDYLKLSSIYYNWRSDHIPEVTEIGVRVTSMEDMTQMKKSIDDLYDLIAVERLKTDISSREPAAKYGIFTDPFNDNDLRDLGVTQNAVVVANELRPRIIETLTELPSNNDDPLFLDFTEEVGFVQQPLRSDTLAVNPTSITTDVDARLQLYPKWDSRVKLKKATSVSVKGVWVDDAFVTWHFVPGWTDFTVTYLSEGGSLVVKTVSDFKGRIPFMRVRNIRFRLVAKNSFQPGEQVQDVFFAGRSVTPNSYRTADNKGRILGYTTIQVPDDVPAGVVVVSVVGDQGSVAAAYYSAQSDARKAWRAARKTPLLETDILRPGAGALAPVAQLFTCPDARQVTSVNLKFTEIGTTDSPVNIQIVEVVSGVPTTEVVANTSVAVEDIVTDGTFVTAAFELPIYLRKGQQYALIVQTNDPQHSLAIGQLGAEDNIANELVSTEGTPVGYLLTSADGKNWLTQPTLALTFQLNAATYTATTKTVDMGTFAVTNMSDLAISAPLNLPAEGTSVVYQVNVVNSGETFVLEPEAPINLQASLSDSLQVNAVLTGTTSLSPIVYNGQEAAIGRLESVADYQSREFSLNSTGSTLKVFFEAYLTGTASVTVEYRDGTSTFVAMTLDSTNPVGDGWNEYVYTVSAPGLTATALRLELNGTPQFRPKTRALRVVYV